MLQPVPSSLPRPGRPSRAALMAALAHGQTDRVVAIAGALAPIRRPLPGAMTLAADVLQDADALRMVGALLDAGLDADTLGSGEQDTALRRAVRGQRWATAARLLAAGGHPDGPPVDQRSARMQSLYEVAAHGPLTLLQAFLQAGERWGRREPWGDDRPTRAAFLVMEHWITTDLQAGTPPDSTMAHRLHVMDALLATGLNQQVRESRHQRSLLALAVVLRDADLVGRLLDQGFPVVGSSYEAMGDAQDSHGWPGTEKVWLSLAHLAVKTNHGPVVERLLAHGVAFEGDSERPTAMGNEALGTPLALARQTQATAALVAIERHALRQAMGRAPTTGGPAPTRARL